MGGGASEWAAIGGAAAPPRSGERTRSRAVRNRESALASRERKRRYVAHLEGVAVSLAAETALFNARIDSLQRERHELLSEVRHLKDQMEAIRTMGSASALPAGSAWPEQIAVPEEGDVFFNMERIISSTCAPARHSPSAYQGCLLVPSSEAGTLPVQTSALPPASARQHPGAARHVARDSRHRLQAGARTARRQIRGWVRPICLAGGQSTTFTGEEAIASSPPTAAQRWRLPCSPLVPAMALCLRRCQP